jgi:UDP-3-O-[3-hydroxymyristoyl] glucosamine N-acyltransferase
MQKTLQEVAQLVKGEVMGDPSIKITGVTNINDAGPTEITFAVEPHLKEAEHCHAGAVLIPDTIESFALPAIRVVEPRTAFTKLLEVFTLPLNIRRGVSNQAYIGANVRIGKNVSIMPFAVVDDNAEIGDNVILYPHTYIGQYALVGDDSLIYSSVTVREFCKIGCRVILHSSAVIGADGFGFITKDGKHTKVPQVGNVVIEDDVEIGANVGIDRATTGSTIVRQGTKIDNLVHIGHNCEVGESNLIVSQTGIAGSTIVGKNVTFGGQVGVVGHINIGANAVFAARSGLTNDTPEGIFYAGFPARPHQEWLRSEVAIKHLPDMSKRIRALEKRLQQLEGKK